MDAKWRDEVRNVPSSPLGNAGLQMSNRPGEALFRKLCAPCHTIGVGDRIGPDLRGVTQRRDHAWLSSFIQNPSRMLAQRDPIALDLAAKFPAVHMPVLGLHDADAADLINYLETQNARIEDTRTSSPSPGHDHLHHDHQDGKHDHKH
jgi:mono/diheme cytochrome c family protein